ncbi:hypothetical protein EXIGLDRAFT_838559 [Exidia glandulosa HHB12029]|uniref:TNFR-Cys domain-containing protein n=1 Tax=Exidia glandulosa HHB12029 TaxID=1314781 RepID=A0A166A7Y3_EXIGL|nr:hypothetical protein EXIGLDRAFT_838559 [Exidia glandulosa HHB12029]
MPRPRSRPPSLRPLWLPMLGVVVLGMFFGLFFGLNYPEIVRHGWPLTRCRVLDARVDQRYCCKTTCSALTCSSAPFGAPSCGTVVSQIDGQFSPSTCAANSTACPAATSGTCDNGYQCCSQCCQTCQSCSTSCTTNSDGSKSCHQSCTTKQCNCYCCNSTAHKACSYSCPTCYNDVLTISYTTYKGQAVNATYRQDFDKDESKAIGFLDEHPVDSISACYYNPSNLNQIAFDVKFTAWKWVVTALFGMVPLLALLLFLLGSYALMPLVRAVKRRRARSQGIGHTAEGSSVQQPEHKRVTADDAPPPPYHPPARSTTL